MRMIATWLYIYASILCGWAVITAFVWNDVTESVARHTYIARDVTLQPLPRSITGLLGDIESTRDMPYYVRDTDTLAADVGDEYIALGDDFYTLPQDIQRFIMAHEMNHYNQKHHIHDMVTRTCYLPIIMLVFLTICIGIWFQRIHRMYVGIRHAIHHIATRTFGLHARGVQAVISTLLHLLLSATIAGLSGITCDAIYTYITPGLEQYIEYRADVYAIHQTHDADAPCGLFDSDQPNPGTHPHDIDRRSYIRYCQAHRYALPTWREMVHLLTPQQICGAVLYHMTDTIPHHDATYTWLRSVSQWLHPEESVL